MRVLFVHKPVAMISNHLVPLGWALRAAGHEVRFACQTGGAQVITEAGHTAVPLGTYSDPQRFALAQMYPDLLEAQRQRGLPGPYDVVTDPAKATWDYLLPETREVVSSVYRWENFPILRDLVDFARFWGPDLVIWEPTAYAAPIAAKACGAAHARLLYTIDIHGVTREHYLRLKEQQPEGQREDPLAEWLDGYARKYGSEFSEDMTTGHFTIDQFPRSLQIEASDLHYVRSQFVPYNGTSVVPRWLWEAPQRPRVALTLGRSATESFDGYAVDVQEILDALADLDIELVATIAEKEQAKLTRIPDNTRILPFVPLHALAPTCSAVIHHAGAATLATVSRYAVPQLSIPLHHDQPALADLLDQTNAALSIHNDHATGPAIRHAVQRLLAEPAFQQGATRLADEIRALPTPNELVPTLEKLTAEHRTRPSQP